jgi:hypothetical protein
VTTTPQEPTPDTADEPILNNREQAAALKAEDEPAERDDGA